MGVASETISLTELRPRLSELIERANERYDRFVITRRGRAEAVLLASDEFEGLLETQARRSYERLARSDRRLFRRLDRALDRLASGPEAGKPLVGPLQGRRSYRVGSVRIIYRWHRGECWVLVLDISQRGRAYR